MPQLGDSQLGTSQLGSPGTLRKGTEWRVLADGVEQENLFDVEVVDTANPFGTYAVLYIDDTNGSAFSTFSRGTRIDIEYREDADTFTPRFAGFAVEPKESNRGGADSLEVECYSFDQFLRRDTVSNNQSGNTISQALQDIIQTDTPVDYVAGNVSVENDITLTQSFRGERVENVLRALVGKSANEDFGVNSDLEFFFRPRETTSTSRDIDNTQWLDYDIPERGKETVNEVRVFYDSGNKSVTVDNGADKLALQDSLGTSDPVKFAEEVSRPEITNVTDAKDVGQSILQDRQTTITGTVTTFGLYDAVPGQVINITINDRGIDSEFRIAEVEYRWGSDETIFTIVEKRGNQDDLLVNLSDTLKRIETQDVNRDGENNRVVETEVDAEITTSTSLDSAVVTNTFVNALRDAYIDAATLDVTEIAYGDDGSNLSRANTALGNELGRDTVSQTLTDSNTVTFEITLTQTGVEEIGLFDSNGDMYVRAVADAPTDFASETVSISLSVGDAADDSRTVLTNTGQTLCRDIISDNSPDYVESVGFGSSSTMPTTADTALGSLETEANILDFILQEADTTAEFDGITSLGATDPIDTSGDSLSLAQTSWTTESSDLTRSGTNLITDGTYSNGEGEELQDTGNSLSLSFTPAYDIPGSDVELWVRFETQGGGTGPAVDVEISDSGGTIDSWNAIGQNAGQTLGWRDLANNPLGGSGSFNDTTLTAGTTYTITLTADDDGTGAGQIVDVVAPLDGRFTYTFDNDNGGSSGYLDGPELYPDVQTVLFNTATTDYSINDVTLTSTWNDTTGDQEVAVSTDGGSTFTTASNSTTVTKTVTGTVSSVQSRVKLDRYGSRSTATPQTGFLGQSISVYDLTITPRTKVATDIGEVTVTSIVQPGTITGVTATETGQLNTADTTLTHSIFAGFTVQSNQQIIGSETLRFTRD